MKKQHDHGGSLELLLDTMCNTFGGVIFIAIALTVVASTIPKMMNIATEEDATLKRVEKLEQEIRRLEQENKRVFEERELKETLERQVKNHPLYKMIAKLAETEALVKKTELALAAANARKQQAETELEILVKQLKKSKQIAKEKKAKVKKIETQIAAVRRKIDFVNNEIQSAESPSMTFRKLSKATKNEIPYFFIVKTGGIWRVGPEKGVKPHQDVTFSISGNRYVCVPLENNRTNLLNGRNVSPLSMKVIASIPGDRFPLFMVYKDSAKEFFKLSEALKKCGTSFDWNLMRDNEPPGYVVADHAEHERN